MAGPNVHLSTDQLNSILQSLDQQIESMNQSLGQVQDIATDVHTNYQSDASAPAFLAKVHTWEETWLQVMGKIKHVMDSLAQTNNVFANSQQNQADLANSWNDMQAVQGLGTNQVLGTGDATYNILTS